ncbi:hypothetical protein ABIA13_002903 [Sinorhizobium fredii]
MRPVDKQDASGQPVEQRNFFRGQVGTLKLAAIAFRSVGKCLVGRVEARISAGDGPRHRFIVGRPRYESDPFARTRLELDGGAQAEDRVENGADRPGQACFPVERQGVRGRTAAAEEFEPIGLIFDWLPILRARRGNMHCPDRLFFGTARPAPCKQGTGPLIKLRFHKELGKGRVGSVGATVVQ